MTGLTLDPDYGVARQVFQRVCAGSAEDWRRVLPQLAAWCVTHPKNSEIFDFTAEGFPQLARLTTPAEALSLLNALPDATPFETLRAAFRAHGDQAYLHRLAPERQHIAIELLKRISVPREQPKYEEHTEEGSTRGTALLKGP